MSANKASFVLQAVVMREGVGFLSLVLVACIWGSSLVLTKDLLKDLPLPLLLTLRFGSAALLLSWVRPRRQTLWQGTLLGTLFFTGISLQALGLMTTTASKAGFVMGLSVVFSPLLSALWLRKRVPVRDFSLALLAIIGIGFMTLFSLEGPTIGDGWMLLAALALALHHLYVGEIARQHEPLELAAASIWVTAAFSCMWAAPTLSKVTLALTPSTLSAVLYLGIVSTVFVRILQIQAQHTVPAHIAELAFTFRTVFSTLFAYLLLAEIPEPSSLLGGCLVLLAMIWSQVKVTQKASWSRKHRLKVPGVMRFASKPKR